MTISSVSSSPRYTSPFATKSPIAVNEPPAVMVPDPTVSMLFCVTIEPNPGTIEPEDSAPTEVSVENDEVLVRTVPVSSGKVISCEALGSSKCSVR